MTFDLSLGAIARAPSSCAFRVWAPFAENVDLVLLGPPQRMVRLNRLDGGYHQAVVDAVEPGQLYQFRLDDQKERPDPASRHQPHGVHGPSEVVAPAPTWNDADWTGLPLEDYVFYELHVGTYTAEGTFDALIDHLDRLRDLGITAIELMPIAQFPGQRNWGYDGVYPFAAQNSYGGPREFRRFVNACHERGLAVVLDVVYNHLGPEGNYLGDFGPYFTDRYRTPWGAALNYDGSDSDEVRRYFIENALYWITECHVDALRLDAVHAIFDHSALTFLEELAVAVAEQAAALNRRIHLIAETVMNDPRTVLSRDENGIGLDAQWNDEFHHALHHLLTGENSGYYADFSSLEDLAKAFTDGYVYTGQYSRFRRRRHGRSSRAVPAKRFVVYAQNHDQIGNRMRGERLSDLVSFEALKLTAGLVSLSPYLPLLFMGEEYGETAPFLYFVSHTDPGLVEAVRRGRKEEFTAFAWQGEPPDPQAEETFLNSRLRHELRHEGEHQALFALFRELLTTRKNVPALRELSKPQTVVVPRPQDEVLLVRRWSQDSEVFLIFHLGTQPVTAELPVPAGRWHKRVASADVRWHGPGTDLPDSVVSDGRVLWTMTEWSFVLLGRVHES